MKSPRFVAATVLCVGVVGCGVPTGGPAVRLPSEQVPYSLLASPPSARATASTPSVDSGLRVFFLDKNRRLRGLPTSNPFEDPVVSGTRLLATLLAGPPETARAEGLSSALGPQVQVLLLRVESRTGIVSWDATLAEPSPGLLPLATGQIVLTLTSAEGIDAVRFLRDGVEVEVPLPSGELSSRPVGADDYLALTAD